MSKTLNTSEDCKRTQLPQSWWSHVRHLLLGRPKDFTDPALTHRLSLIALLAWVGLGADGLSSSAYGPAEAFSTVVKGGGNHAYLAVLIAVAAAFTVFIISYAYSRIIEHFPGGGGGYLVATALLGETAGVVSGSALLVDYILTITVSIAGGGDAVFSLLPAAWIGCKLPVEFAAILGLTLMNMRGVKESVSTLTPIFMTFLVTHIILIVGVLVVQIPTLPETAVQMQQNMRHDLSLLGWLVVFKMFVRAYSLGAGTYTGIEAVSNGLSIMREPRVETGKRTMMFMAVSLAATAGGLLLCYALVNVPPDWSGNKTLNTVLAESFAGAWKVGGLSVGGWFVWVTIFSEAVLLLVAAQTGFIDGPRVMANMAIDDWMPHRFAALSDRLTMQNGILIIGGSALGLLAFTRGHIDMLVVMYSINVFVTFSLSEFGMSRFWIRGRKTDKHWLQHLAVHAIGLCLCFSILCVMVVEKLWEGAWITLIITVGLILVCVAIRRHYRHVHEAVQSADRNLTRIEKMTKPAVVAPEFQADQTTAVLLVKEFNGLGIHSMLSIFRLFPNAFKNVVFISVGVVDSGFFKGSDQVKALEAGTKQTLARYTQLACSLGIPAKSFYKIGTDVVSEASNLCVEVAEQCPRATFFAGEVLFGRPRWYDKLLHNDVAYAIQRRIRFVGLSMVVLPMLIQQFTTETSSLWALLGTLVPGASSRTES